MIVKDVNQEIQRYRDVYRMTQPLKPTKREEMFKAWCDDPRVHHVHTTCAISKGAVRRYRKLDDWDSRLEKIKAQARNKADQDEVRHTEEQLRLIRRVKDVYIQCLTGRARCEHCGKFMEVPTLEPKYADIEKIVRLEEFMRGKPDSRPDIGRVLEQMSDEDFLALWERSCVDIVDRLKAIRAMVRGKRILAAIDELIGEVGK